MVVHRGRYRVAVLGYVDSGADSTVFPSSVAVALNIDIAGACEQREFVTAAGRVTQPSLPEGLEIEIEELRVHLRVGASFNPHVPIALLGRRDFFSRFRRVCFEERSRTLVLEPYSQAA
jgi:hypothetical protein